MDLTGTYRIFYRKSREHSFFLAAHGNVSKINHILGNKASFKNIGNLK
jgi:hypothetical protein